MKELKEIRFNESNIQLKDNLVKGSILPEKVAELTRTITIQGDTVIEGPVYAHKLEIQNGDLEIQGAVFTQLELYVNSEAQGNVAFQKSVGSANSIVSRADKLKLTFHSDINAKSVTLYNAFIAGSIYADEIVLDNCVVCGGVFATQQIDLKNSVVGTFNTPSIRIEKMLATANAQLYNLSLADLGALYKGLPQTPNSGKITMDIETDEVKSTLVNNEIQKTLRSYTVVGKVLAVDLIDTDKFENHFLLTAASLGAQLLKTYDLGVDKNGNAATLTLNKIRDFFFDILNGKISVQDIDGKFDISQLNK